MDSDGAGESSFSLSFYSSINLSLFLCAPFDSSVSYTGLFFFFPSFFFCSLSLFHTSPFLSPLSLNFILTLTFIITLGDSLYSTAPSSPELAPSRRRESYDEALRKSDLLAQEPHVINSKPDEHHAIKLSDSFSGQSPPVPKHVGSQGKTKGVISPLLDSIPQPPIPEVISANPVHVQVGFQAPDVGSNSLETTALSSLPGTVDVITSPPMLQKQQPSQAQHIPPSSLSRPRSIEEIDQERRNYVPTVLTNKKKPVLYQEREAGFCLDLATLTGYVAPPRPLDFVEPEIFDPVIEGEPSSGKLRSLSFELKDVVS